MKKLKLNLEDLKVESFETNPMQSKMGTVLGNLKEGDTQPPENCNGGGGGTLDIAVYTCNLLVCNTMHHIYTCGGQNTCGETCLGTCPQDYSCWYTCGCPR